jgi:hypothetical protein
VTNTLGNILRRSWLGHSINPAAPAGLLSPVEICALAKE